MCLLTGQESFYSVPEHDRSGGGGWVHFEILSCIEVEFSKSCSLLIKNHKSLDVKAQPDYFNLIKCFSCTGSPIKHQDQL